MRRRAVTSAVAIVMAAAASVWSAGVAAAAPTITTFTLTAGTLAVVPLPTAVLGNFAAGSTSVSGGLGLVTVTDLRGTTTPWVATVSSTPFTGPSSTTSTAISYNAGAVTTVLGTITIPTSSTVAISTTPAAVVSPSSLLGINTVTWVPTLTVTLPQGAVAGLYTGTVTTSVA